MGPQANDWCAYKRKEREIGYPDTEEGHRVRQGQRLE